MPAEISETVMGFHQFLFRTTGKYLKKLEGIDITNIRIYPNTRIHQIALKDGNQQNNELVSAHLL
ncbi:MAG: hypothetical protein NWE95_07150 [Candidatus Bathyarchaeota archaeon]|nr:hypothetical protein [Candidatus Bathyarchaeota archaeon]